ncbi:hypothetical protein OCU04_006137 [Sclerotinia nivalis]|uniref:Uncharacterized protein n=1 Tax=Sclerotinia nivalis TaxID=352851 RepID=A0A9X0AMD1_9HELO|nr:hypothetical protein OCU04_006137 [Sclerotinia nivalis]
MNSNEGPLHLGYHIWTDMDLSQEYQFFPPTLVFDPAYAYAYDHQMIARSSHICCIAATMNKWTDHDIIRNHPTPAIGTHYAFMTLLLFPSTLFSIIYHAAAAAVLHKSWPRDS